MIRPSQPVRLRPAEARRAGGEPESSLDLERLLDRVASAVGDVTALLAIAQQAGRSAPKPGDGRTAQLWELLASVAAVDVAAARVMEPHLDAGAILAQAGTPEAFTGSWGVYAAEAPGTRLTAGPVTASVGGLSSAGEPSPADGQSSDQTQAGEAEDALTQWGA